MPPTEPPDPLSRIYAEWSAEFAAAPDMTLPVLRWVFEDWQRAATEPEGVTYRSTDLGGVEGVLVTPLESDPDQVFVVLHGGGFALGSSASHRKLAGHLAAAAGVHAFVADFRRAPEFPYPAQLDDTDRVLDALLTAGRSPRDLTLVGDSAGASVAVATVLRRLRDGRPVPQQVVTVSPWLDMENSGTTIETNDATDVLIAREGLQGNIDRYLSGGADPRDPLVNPLHATFTGFPRCYVTSSTTESLYDDAVRLVGRLRSAAVDVTFEPVEGEQHVWPLQAGNHPPADASIQRIAHWYHAGRAADAA